VRRSLWSCRGGWHAPGRRPGGRQLNVPCRKTTIPVWVTLRVSGRRPQAGESSLDPRCQPHPARNPRGLPLNISAQDRIDLEGSSAPSESDLWRRFTITLRRPCRREAKGFAEAADSALGSTGQNGPAGQPQRFGKGAARPAPKSWSGGLRKTGPANDPRRSVTTRLIVFVSPSRKLGLA
jgi:hypothetical protein